MTPTTALRHGTRLAALALGLLNGACGAPDGGVEQAGAPIQGALVEGSSANDPATTVADPGAATAAVGEKAQSLPAPFPKSDDQKTDPSLKEGPTPPPRARFRAVILGFRVNQETWDDAFEWDGKRDEVYIDYAVQSARADRMPLGEMVHRQTAIIGDTWRLDGRHQGGSASDRGGLMTGDAYPNPDPTWSYVRRAADALPLEIWSGELVQGENGVVIVPSIWEWDRTGNSLAEDWALRIYRAVPRLTDFAGSLARGTTAGRVLGGIGELLPALERFVGGILGDDNTRPIGMVRNTAGDQFVYEPQAIALNYDDADRLTRTEFVEGRPGVLAVNFRDDSFLRGDYTLYVGVQRQSDETPP